MSEHQEQPLRVLVLTEQRLLAEMVKLTLNHGVYIARDAKDLGAAMAMIDDWQPQLAVVDMDSGGDRLVRRIGQSQQDGSTRIPVLALTRRGDLKTKLAAFDQGADDIMTVPLSPEELLARVLVITRRRFGGDVSLKPLLKLGELEIDILNRRVHVGSSELHLTGIEQSLHYFLAANAGQIVTRDEIMNALWGIDFPAESNVVDRHIHGLRVKLQNGWRHPRYIATVPGEGYRFLPVSSEAESTP
ncbi:MAG TPA: response regulator transcription factor [Chloroflexota bacterium]|nr:response regulator transcription factor [Chloroflexota bacterium]